MYTFKKLSSLACSQEQLFQYHANPGALNRLIPPWESVVIEKRGDSLSVNTEVVLRNSLFGIPLRWHARHTQLDAPRYFQDIQLSGPFKTWIHDHRFEEAGGDASVLQDSVQYEMKIEPFGKLGLPLVRSKLEAMFAYRHDTTKADLMLQAFLRERVGNKRMRVGITGSSGLIGRRLVDLLSVLGHHVVRILRPSSQDRPLDFALNAESVVWSEASGFSNPGAMEGLDAVVHLSGQGIASSRWNNATKQAIRNSRVQGTRSLVEGLCKLGSPPKALVCASGVGVYGDREAEVLDESAPAGNDFLADLARDWEEAAMEYERSGNRVAIGRLGIALHPQHGALAKLLLPFRFGLGGILGSGRQYWSWIHVDDAAAAFLYLAANEQCHGPTNLVAPEQTDNRTFVRTLGKVLHRPTLLPVPAFALRMIVGEMADAMLLASTRAECKKLSDTGFPFRARTLESCFKHLLGM